MTAFINKLKKRLYLAIGYVVIGLALCVVSFVQGTENNFISSFGFAFFGCGIVRIRNYFLITKNEQSLRRQEIRETDERNIEIMYKAKSMTFNIALCVAGLTIVVLQLMEMYEKSMLLAYGVCFLTLLYCACYIIIRKRN